MEHTARGNRLCAALLCAVLLLALCAGMPLTSSFAATITMDTDLHSEYTANLGDNLSMQVSASLPGGTVTYSWYKDGKVIKPDAGHIDGVGSNTLNITGVKASDVGKYSVKVVDDSNSDNYIYSAMAKLTLSTSSSSTPSTGSGGLYVTGYTVLAADGHELQKVNIGEKCKIVVGVHDGRFAAMPTKVDAYNNIVNVKLTSTGTFATPTFGDIGISTPKWLSSTSEIEYAVTFNDIMYLGGSNELAFDLSYVDHSVAMQNVSVGISQCFDATKVTTAKPTVMVQSSDIGGANVAAGSVFALKLVSYNTSDSLGITDVTTSITLPDSIALAGGSNMFLTSAVGPGASYSGTFALQAQAAAETGVANITINYTYYIAGAGDQLTSSQIVTVPIVQPDRFEFTSLDVPAEAYTGEENTLTVNYVNKGKGTLYNLTASISGNMDNPGQSQYMGNLASGTEGSADFTIQSSGVGTISGTITITYEDVNGEQQQKTEDYSVNVVAAPSVDDGGMMSSVSMPEEGGGGMPWWAYLLILAGIGGGTGITVAAVKKAKRKKRAAELSEDAGDDDVDVYDEDDRT